MTLVRSLFQIIVNIDGDALVMHSGDKPFVVAPSGRVEVAGPGLTLESVSEIVNQLLPQEFQQALDEFGAVRYDFPRHDEFPREQFTLSVTRVDDDVWAEIRRRRIVDDADLVPEEFFETSPPLPAPPAEFGSSAGRGVVPRPAPAAQLADDDLALPQAMTLWPERARPHSAAEHDEDEFPELTAPNVLEPPQEERVAAVPPPISEAAPPPALEMGAAAVAEAARAAVAEAVPGAVAEAAEAARAAVADAALEAVAEAAPSAVAGAARAAVAAVVFAAVGEAVHTAVTEAVPGAVGEAARAAVTEAVPGAVAEAARAAVVEVVAGAAAEAARAAVTDAAPAAVADAAPGAVAEAARAAVAEAVPRAVGEASRAAVAELVIGAVGEAVQTAVTEVVPGAVREATRAAVTQAVPGAVAEAARAAVADAVPAAVAEAVPGIMAEAARSAVADAAPGAVAEAAPRAVAEAAPRAVAEAARAAVAAAVPGAVDEAARVAVAEVVIGAVVGEAARAAVAGAVSGAVAEAARAAVAETAPEAVADAARAAVAEAARDTVSEVAPAAVAEAVRATVAQAVPEAVAEAARATVANAVPAAVAEAVRATVAGAVPAAVSEAARAAVTDAAPWAVAEAARAIVVEAARAAVADMARAAVAEVVPAAVAAAAHAAVADAAAATLTDATRTAPSVVPQSGDRSSQSVANEANQDVFVKPPAAASLRSAPAPPGSPRLSRPYEVVPPISRSPIRAESSQPSPVDTLSGLERLLRVAAARGASTLYLSSNARPSVRVDGQVQVIDSEPVHTASDVISLLMTLMPDRRHEVRQIGATTEWICDIDDIGRVRCTSFNDQRSPGGVFRMPVRAVSVDQLGLAREIQLLAMEPEGLVLVAGPRSSGKRTLMSALVDLINRTRRGHVITIEREVNIVHAQGNSVISQREVRGNDGDVLAAARAALREDPDVLLLEQIRTGTLMTVALEAAASGHLVIGGFSAHNTTESIDRIIDLYTPEYTPRQAQLALADNLRGVVAQVLLAKDGGGRVAAREVLLNTASVANAIAEGRTSQLPMAIEGGRRHGMVPLNDALIAYVRKGIVDVAEAYRHVIDRPAFVALLKRQGIDTSAIERLAQSTTTNARPAHS